MDLFVSYGYWLNSENKENDLNSLTKKKRLPGWGEFWHSTGYLDHDLECYRIVCENEQEKKVLSDLKYLEIKT